MNWPSILTWAVVCAAFAFLLHRARRRLLRERAQQGACGSCVISQAARRDPHGAA